MRKQESERVNEKVREWESKWESTFGRVKSQTPGLVDVVLDQLEAAAAVHGADPDHPRARVGEVNVSGQAVDGHVFWNFQGSVDNDPERKWLG